MGEKKKENNSIRTETAKKNSHRRLPIKRHSNSNSEEHTFEFRMHYMYHIIHTYSSLGYYKYTHSTYIINLVLTDCWTLSTS